MYYSKLLLAAAAAFTGLASAQNFDGQNYSVSGPIAVQPNSVDFTTRNNWCIAQHNSCPLICGGSFANNTCDANTLTYSCTCQSGNTPNISAYEQTLPFYICQQWQIECVSAHPNDLFAIAGCHSLVCGSLNASSGESGSSSSSSSSATTTAMATTTSGSAESTSTSATATASTAAASSGAAVVNMAKQYGTGILATGLLALFGLAL